MKKILNILTSSHNTHTHTFCIIIIYKIYNVQFTVICKICNPFFECKLYRTKDWKFARVPTLLTAYYSLRIKVSGTKKTRIPRGPPGLCWRSAYWRFNETIWVASTTPCAPRLCCINRALFLRAPSVDQPWHAFAATYTRTFAYATNTHDALAHIAWNWHL